MNDSLLQVQSRPKRRLLAAISGLLLILATPPIPLYALAWFGLVPFFRALEHAESRREAQMLGFTFAFVWHAGTMYWIAWNSGTHVAVSIVSALGLAWLLSLWFGLVAVLHRQLLRAFGTWAHLLAVILYMASDVVWQSGDWSFPWISFALTQGQSLQLLQLTAIGGSVLMTGFIALLNAILTIGGRHWASLALTVLLLVSVWTWGNHREHIVHDQTAGTDAATVAIVQGNIDPDWKYKLGYDYSMNMYDALSTANVADSVDLMVWPENAAPVYVEQDYRWRRYIQKMVDRIGATLVTGGRFAEFHEDNSRTPYNAAFLIRPNGMNQFLVYNKVYLVPFGERIPFQWAFPFLRNLDFGQAEFAPGDGIVSWPFRVNGDSLCVSPLICYEAIFPEAGWKATHLDADILLNMTNDGWFTGTGQQLQHLLLSRMRSIETGRSLVRSTNTGISAFITPSGRFAGLLGSDQRGVIVHTVERPVDTPFVAWGWHINLLALWTGGALVILSLIVSVVKRLSRR